MEDIMPDFVRWNPTKYDNAAAHQLRTVLREPADVYRDRLLERQGNPLVDVSVLLAAQDRQQLRASPNGSSPPSPGKPVGAGAWLAFTRLLPA
jgi:hypothetical protein